VGGKPVFSWSKIEEHTGSRRFPRIVSAVRRKCAGLGDRYLACSRFAEDELRAAGDDGLAQIRASLAELLGEPQAAPETIGGDRMLVLFDLNETLLLRPWDEGQDFPLPAQDVLVSELPSGASGKRLRLYHRPGARDLFELLRAQADRCTWGFYTDMRRGNAKRIVGELLSRSIGLRILKDDGVRLTLARNSCDSTETVWMFDNAHCDEGGGEKGTTFNLERVALLAGSELPRTSIVAASHRKCQRFEAHMIPVERYREDLVQTAGEAALTDVAAQLRARLAA